jgi:hypothetical protein
MVGTGTEAPIKVVGVASSHNNGVSQELINTAFERAQEEIKAASPPETETIISKTDPLKPTGTETSGQADQTDQFGSGIEITSAPTSPPTEPTLPSTEAIGDTNAAAVEPESAPGSETAAPQPGEPVGPPTKSDGTFTPKDLGENLQPQEDISATTDQLLGKTDKVDQSAEVEFIVSAGTGDITTSSEEKSAEPLVFPKAADQSGKQEISSAPNTIDEKPKDEKPAETKPITAETLEEKYEKIMQGIEEQVDENDGKFYVTVGTGDNEVIILPVAMITPGKFSNKDALLLVSKKYGPAEIDLHNHAVNPFIRDPLTLAEERKQMNEAQLEEIKNAIEKYNKPRPPKEHLKEGIFRENGRLEFRVFDPKSPLHDKFVDFDITSEIPDPEKLKKAIAESKKSHASNKEAIQDKRIREFLNKKNEIADKTLKAF